MKFPAHRADVPELSTKIGSDEVTPPACGRRRNESPTGFAESGAARRTLSGARGVAAATGLGDAVGVVECVGVGAGLADAVGEALGPTVGVVDGATVATATTGAGIAAGEPPEQSARPALNAATPSK